MVSISEVDVTDTGFVTQPDYRQIVAELMSNAPDGPLLRERAVEIRAAAKCAKGENVLNDSGFLVVRLFHEKTVVLHNRWRVRLSAGERWCDEEYERQIV